MLEIRVNGLDDIQMKGDGTEISIIADSSLAIATIAKSLSENTGIPVKECLGGLMSAANFILDDYRVEAVGSCATMPDIEKFMKKDGEGG